MGSNSKLAEQIMAGVPPETYRKAVHLLTTFDRRKELRRHQGTDAAHRGLGG